MSKLEFVINELRVHTHYGKECIIGPNVGRELVEDFDALKAQLEEAKNLFLTERTEGLTDLEQQEEWDDAEEYFDRMMELTAKQQSQREG